MPIRYVLAAAAGASVGILFVLKSEMFSETTALWLWLIAVLALIAGAKLGIFICYMADMAMGNAPDIRRSPRK